MADLHSFCPVAAGVSYFLSPQNVNKKSLSAKSFFAERGLSRTKHEKTTGCSLCRPRGAFPLHGQNCYAFAAAQATIVFPAFGRSCLLTGK
jgi:hypothetical protein